MTEVRAAYGVGENATPTRLAVLRCRNCSRELASVLEHNGRTALAALFAIQSSTVTGFATRASLRCLCGATREFYSVPMSAIHLGIERIE